ncbi:unnamed protein product [Cuscuta campestris]|uniref:TF-B3 domain-containing protein n=1 Tax=Cuscuta campestris TaxID=132261 RepID=A0A484MT97_9ASTE|nr:unnamed protein product [Cuscuta campestris]
MSFSIKMKPSNRYRVTMPSNFLRETGMMGTRCLVLEDLRGREWPVLMSAHCQRSTNRTDMGRGWNEFRVKNGLLDGDTCTFSYTGGDEEGEDGSSGWLLQVDVMRASPKMEGCGSSLRQTRSKASH